ncbi:DinB family protein [Hyunsoonleella pacifica]|uniref:DinB family protein n=1 Tax=Hyunsoonleella pacifica TaxID=1080224 RepID=A0A4Q9FSK9_9FLAO|nr:DinB family protein [Hyunsoonleella pacifica]TBN18993.1 DinB family protein [Hyunsoonleella pacifica]GGD06452.1 hypothetical protein GCM10011368_05400 [Hyunsoonleella pacifica]
MKRRQLLGIIGLSPLAFISSRMPVSNAKLVDILIKRWKTSKTYTLEVFNTMPEESLEYSPTDAQMSFAQHFMHIGFTNNAFIGVLVDSKTYPDFAAMSKAAFFLERPDSVSVFYPDMFVNRDPKMIKTVVAEYLLNTFDYVISNLSNLNDDILSEGVEKEKPWFLGGHTNIDLILRAENHTAHHRAQAISYLRFKGIKPPAYSKFNTL